MRRNSNATSLYRLVYCSRRTTTVGETEPDVELADIVSACRMRNQLNAITGALLSTGFGFAQLLEGPREAVEHAFDRIVADRRHADVTMLSFTPVERRTFPHQPLGASDRLPSGVLDIVADLLRDVAAGQPRLVTAGDIVRLLERTIPPDRGIVAA